HGFLHVLVAEDESVARLGIVSGQADARPYFAHIARTHMLDGGIIDPPNDGRAQHRAAKLLIFVRELMIEIRAGAGMASQRPHAEPSHGGLLIYVGAAGPGGPL